MRSSSPFLTKEYGARVDKALDKVQGISLPNILFPTVIESLVSLEIKKLESITWDLLEKCHHLFEQTLLAEVNHVAPPDNSALSHLLKTIVQDKLEMQRRGAEAAIKECLQNENDAYTLNGCYQDTLGKIQQTVVQQGETADLNSPHVVSDGFSVNDLTGITFEVVGMTLICISNEAYHLTT